MSSDPRYGSVLLCGFLFKDFFDVWFDTDSDNSRFICHSKHCNQKDTKNQ
ncbi:MAG: hypothetical protein LBO67_04650 [Spirochaetaceae bacterium]|nr:hypothetical protein [Spirochaetaceae bacterium]